MTILGLFSVFCFLYPSVSNVINEMLNQSTINNYNSNIDSASQEDIHRKLVEAENYNKLLATDYFQDSEQSYNETLYNYYNILNVNDGIMGYIEIPSVNIRLPIYHGESEEVLKQGAAHLEQTSFPVPGTDTHACISAHSGFPTQKFFDDIDELVNQDIIYVKILKTTYVYRVFGKDVIEPDDISKLKIVKGENFLTLITCYPYGINSHRLLVHARYIGAETTNQATADEIKIHSSSKINATMPIAGVVVASALLLTVAWVISRNKRKMLK